MSVHRVERKDGVRFVVRNRDAAGVNTARAFRSEEEAARYQRQIDTARAARRERELAEQLDRF